MDTVVHIFSPQAQHPASLPPLLICFPAKMPGVFRKNEVFLPTFIFT